MFENYVVLTYSEKLSDHTEYGRRPSVTGCRPDPDGAMVCSKIIRGSGAYQPIQVDWRLTAQVPAPLSIRSAIAQPNCKL